MTWDNECETKAWELMQGFANDKDKPPLEEQERAANWLNQMLPYPGWRFEVYRSRYTYWVLTDRRDGHIYLSEAAGYTYGMSGVSADTLIELITKLEMGL